MTERSVLYPRTDDMIWQKRVFPLKREVVDTIKQSMLAIGQLQPIAIIPGKPNSLKIGRHRYQAVKELYAEKPDYKHFFLGAPCPPGTIAAIDIRTIDPAILLDMEISENVHRMDLTWQEKATALALVHQTELQRHEDKIKAGEIPAETPYTISSTARKLAGATGGSEAAIRNRVSQALIVANHLDDPEVAKAESARSGWNTIKTKLTIEARKAGVDQTGETPHTLIVGDCRQEMLKLQEQFDLILADPPYGIGANTYDNMRHHKYDDSWENAEALYRWILTYTFEKLTKPRANVFLFCTPERWHCVRDLAAEAGWVPWPRPIIWKKSNEGMRPWGAAGLAYTYETILWATKGQRGLIQTSNDVFDIYRPKWTEREHAAAKPFELYQRLIEITCLPGDTILDPCVGSGTSFKAGFLQNVSVVGIEHNPETAEIARKNMYWKNAEEETKRVDPNDNLDTL